MFIIYMLRTDELRVKQRFFLKKEKKKKKQTLFFIFFVHFHLLTIGISDKDLKISLSNI